MENSGGPLGGDMTADRRTVLKRAAAGTGVGVATFAAPTIASTGLVPRLAAAATTPVGCETVVGTWSESCFPSLGGLTPVSGTLEADLSFDVSITTGNFLVDPILNAALGAIPPIGLAEVPYSLSFPTTGTYCDATLDDLSVDTTIGVPDAICGLFDQTLDALLAGIELVPATVGTLSLDLMDFVADLTLTIPGWGSAGFTLNGDLGDPPTCGDLVAALNLILPDTPVDGLGDPCVIEECADEPCVDCVPAPAPPASVTLDIPDGAELSLTLQIGTDLTFDPAGFLPPLTLSGDITGGATAGVEWSLPDIVLTYGGTITCEA